MNTSIDYLVVGHGIGGATIARHLLDSGVSVVVVDDPNPVASSKVAAGIFNPFTGSRLSKTWLADTLYAYAVEYYTHLGTLYSPTFFHRKPLLQLFRDAAQQQRIMNLKRRQELEDWGVEFFDSGASIAEGVTSHFGGYVNLRAFWIDIPNLLEQSKQSLLRKGCYREAKFSMEDVVDSSGVFCWNDLKFRNIIFTCGVTINRISQFSHLILEPNKGEILDVAIDNLSTDFIINGGKFVLPAGGNLFRIGSTYSWSNIEPGTTSEAAESILRSVRQFIQPDIKVVAQRYGVRPTSLDKRPIIGQLKSDKRISVLNGLGTKGVSLAPYAARLLKDLLLYNKPVPDELDLYRPMVPVNRNVDFFTTSTYTFTEHNG